MIVKELDYCQVVRYFHDVNTEGAQEKRRIEFAIQLVQSAGEVVKDFFGKKYTIKSKGKYKNSLVTEADLISENLIISQIKIKFPADAILSEEFGYIHKELKSRIWIVDPLDGTWNFIHGIQNCGVMIAYAEADQVKVGVVYNPFKGTIAHASRGRGAYLNGKLISLCEVKGNLPMIVDESDMRQKIKHKRKVDLRSTVDNTIMMLSQQAIAYVNITAKIWDLSPASILFEEAGLVISTVNGGKYIWHENDGLIATPKTIHKQIIQEITMSSGNQARQRQPFLDETSHLG